MESKYKPFFNYNSFLLIGDSQSSSFPSISYQQLKKRGKKVLGIDSKLTELEGDKIFRTLEDINETIEAAMIEVARADSAIWVEKLANKGIKNIWIHMGRDSKQARERAEKLGVNLFRGSCAAMYLVPGFSYHSIHKCINKILKIY